MKLNEILKNVVNLSMESVEINISTLHLLSGIRDVKDASISLLHASEELSTSITNLQGTAERSSHAAQESNSLINNGMIELGELKRDIIQTGSTFNTVSTQTQDLQNAVSNLGKVVELISKIANQTNLLALNATIEAARAGEHGKGFAVVANEVKSLSRQTRDATETISNQINQLNASFTEVLGSMSSAQATISSVVGKAEKVSEDFEKISTYQHMISDQVSDLACDLAGIMSQQSAASSLQAKNMATIKDKSDSNFDAINNLIDQSDRRIQLIENWRTQLAGEEIENKVIYLAQADHFLWKKRLLDMAVGRSTIKSSDLTDHISCRLGKWYYDRQENDKFNTSPAFRAIEEPHKIIHKQGIEAAKCFERNDFITGMKHYEQLEQASHKVVEELENLLKQE